MTSLRQRIVDIDRQLKDGLITLKEASMLKKRAREADKAKRDPEAQVMP